MPPMVKHAIIVSETSSGWRWELIDVDGASIDCGVAIDQARAMDSAREASTAAAEIAVSNTLAGEPTGATGSRLA